MCGRPAGWRVLAGRARLGRPGSRLPLRASVAGLGHIVAAARLQLVTLADLLPGV